MIQTALPQLIPSVEVIDVVGVGGGCISEAFRVEVQEDFGKRVLFVKSNELSFLDNFQTEQDGLLRLGEPGVIGVPQPIAVGTALGRAWLVTEWVEQHRIDAVFFSRFGTELASLHQATLGDRIGLERDGYLGSADQLNGECGTWPEFFASRRIEFQIRRAVDQGLASRRLKDDCERIVVEMADLLDGREDRTSLLHGDLWSGNYLCSSEGQPVIFDPAAHFGCREAEFGMLQLFGSCSDDFYEAYQAAFPLPGGWQRRVRVYVLYHLLNHLNLFGVTYRGQCETVSAAILRR
ncbi:MAG: fructosamine kinase family protein [Rubripirellula sp.]